MIRTKHARRLIVFLFAVLIVVVFHQIATNMAEQGIASGGPYDNAAAYPGTLVVLIGILVALITALEWRQGNRASEVDSGLSIGEIIRPCMLLIIFAAYLGGLGTVGYHISTPIMIMAFLFLCGIRKPVEIVVSGILISLIVAFFFEVPLKIVLPGGFFGLNIPW